MNTEKLEIYYIRHGDTEGAEHGSRSVCDIDLNENGIMQASLLSERFEGKSFDAVFSSPLLRAVRTAAAVTEKLCNPDSIEIIDALIENGSDSFEGTDIENLRKYSPLVKKCPDEIPAEGLDDYSRAKAVVEYLRHRFGYGARVLVFAHGTFGTDFINAAVGIEKSAHIFSLNNTSVSKIKFTSDGKARISFTNDVSHLYPVMPDFHENV